MIVIRLRRTGKKHEPTYRIVATDRRKSVYSPYLEMLGTYNPRTKQIVLDKEKTLAWLQKGAQPSNTVAKILVKEGLKHNSIVVKQYRAISKKELEKQKAIDEAEKEREQAEKEVAKEAFEEKVEAEKAENASEDRLQTEAAESIAEEKQEEAKAVEEKAAKTEKPEEAEKPAEEAKGATTETPAK